MPSSRSLQQIGLFVVETRLLQVGVKFEIKKIVKKCEQTLVRSRWANLLS